eukprot:m.96206 g.96206  ORF g.96206 m.96206 type:complete len:926 (-) comp14785_c1_seq1:2282-5059(-)
MTTVGRDVGSTIRREMLHSWNKRLDESSLRNILLELRESTSSLHNVINTTQKVLHEIEKWGKGQSEPIREFLRAMKVGELEIIANIQHYLGSYEDFCTDWKTVLADRKELNECEHELQKAQKAVEQARKKLYKAKKKTEKEQRKAEKAERKEREKRRSSSSSSSSYEEESPTPSTGSNDRAMRIEIAQSELDAKKHAERAAEARFRDKRVETEAEVHKDLRKAYNDLAKIRMEFLQSTTEIVHRMASSVARLPDVAGLSEDESHFRYGPTSAPVPEVSQAWHQGEALQQSLEMERKAATEALQTERERHQEQIDLLTHELDRERASFHEQLTLAQREYQRLLAGLEPTTEIQNMGMDQLRQQMALLSTEITVRDEAWEKLVIDDVRTAMDVLTKHLDSDILVAALSDLTTVIFMTQDMSMASNKSEFGRKIVAFAHQAGVALRAASGSRHAFSLDRLNDFQHYLNRATHEVKNFLNHCHEQYRHQHVGKTTPFGGVSKEKVDKVCNPFNTIFGMIDEVVKRRDMEPAHLSEKVSTAQTTIHQAREQIGELKSLVRGQDERLSDRNEAVLDNSENILAGIQLLVETVGQIKVHLSSSGDSSGIGVLRAHRWFNALESVVNIVQQNLPGWFECLRGFIRDGSYFERLDVSTRALAACCAQLVSLIHAVESQGTGVPEELIQTIKEESHRLMINAHEFLATVRLANQFYQTKHILEDPSKLSQVQARKLVMDNQVEVLRLEQALSEQRERLALLRKNMPFDVEETEGRQSQQQQHQQQPFYVEEQKQPFYVQGQKQPSYGETQKQPFYVEEKDQPLYGQQQQTQPLFSQGQEQPLFVSGQQESATQGKQPLFTRGQQETPSSYSGQSQQPLGGMQGFTGQEQQQPQFGEQQQQQQQPQFGQQQSTPQTETLISATTITTEEPSSYNQP